jgi:hypothetical protein
MIGCWLMGPRPTLPVAVSRLARKAPSDGE